LSSVLFLICNYRGNKCNIVDVNILYKKEYGIMDEELKEIKELLSELQASIKKVEKDTEEIKTEIEVIKSSQSSVPNLHEVFYGLDSGKGLNIVDKLSLGIIE
jgi:hypothetical protein